jgi:hypothetical protein
VCALYQLLLRIEFACAVLGIELSASSPSVDFAASHSVWLELTRFALSSPLAPFLAHIDDFSETSAPTLVATSRAALDAANAVEELSANRGRHACAFCLCNQPSDGSVN